MVVGLGGAPAVVIVIGRSSGAGLRRSQDRRDDRRRAVEVRDAVLGDQPPDHVPAHLAQADVGAADRGDGPRRAPPVAVEHRQRPQVDAVERVAGVHHLAERVQVRPAVRVLHALGPARRAGRVVDRDAARLVLDLPRQRRVPATGEQVLVGDAAAGAVAGASRVDHRDDLLDGLQPAGDRRHRRVQRRVHDQQLRPGVVEDVAHLLGGQPRVDRDEHRLRERHREVRHEHLGHVGQQVGDPVTALDAGAAQRVCHPRDLGGELLVRVPPLAVDDRRALGEDLRGAAQERQWSQRRIPDGHRLLLARGTAGSRS